MKIACKFDMTRLKRAMAQLRPHVKKSERELVETAAKGFVRDVVAITPPASKKTAGNAAKKVGEASIQSDLAKIMVAASKRIERALEQPEAVHKRLRDRRTGRVNPRGLKTKIAVERAALKAYQKKLLARVGWLAAGWNAAAEKLSVKLPAWVKRHGSSYGNAEVSTGANGVRIVLANVVKYVGNVSAYERRVQTAITNQAKKMERQARHLLTRAIRRAGFK